MLGRTESVLSQSVCTHPVVEIHIWDARGAGTLRGLAAAFSIKRKRSQDTLESFSLSFQLPVCSSHFAFTPSPQSQEVK